MRDVDDVEMRLARERDALWAILLRARVHGILADRARVMRREATRSVVVPFRRPPRRR